MAIADRIASTGSGLYSPPCSTCNGSGWDDLFESACACTLAPGKPQFRKGTADSASDAPNERVPMGAHSWKANKYGGKCDTCGTWIGEGAGVLVRTAEGRYGVRHHEGECGTAPAPKAAPAATAAPTVRTIVNRYAGKCYTCGEWVPEQSGLAAKIGERWSIFCGSGCFDDQATPAVVTANRGAVDTLKGLVDQILHTAYPEDDRVAPTLRVAISSAGQNDLSFLVVGRTEKGYRSVKETVGGHGDILIAVPRQIAYAKALAELDRENLLAAAATYGQEMGICARCSKTLTDQHSREAGFGPTCINL